MNMYRLLNDNEIVQPDDEILVIGKTAVMWDQPELSMIGYPAEHCHAVRRLMKSKIEE